MTWIRKYILGSILLMFSCCSTTKSNNEVMFNTLKYSESGNQQEREKLIIRNANTFKQIYIRTHKNNYPIPDVPQINFKKKDVIFLHFGEYRYAGMKINIDTIYWDKKNLVISIDKKLPKVGEPLGTAITYPFLFLEVDKLSQEPTEIKLTF